MTDGVPPDRPVSEPPVDAIPAIVDVRDLVMPLDAYTLGTDDLSTLSRARLALMADCLGRHGFAFEACFDDAGPVVSGGPQGSQGDGGRPCPARGRRSAG